MSSLSNLDARRNQALLAISNVLLERSEYCELQPKESDYRSGVVVWSTTIEADTREWEIHILLTENFPDEPPQVRVPEALDLVLTNPHVLEKGFLCVIPDSSSMDSNDPVGLFFYVVESTKRILEGTEDVDFQHEFSAYWNRSLEDEHTDCLIIDSPEKLPALFHVVFRDMLICISASEKSLNQWCANFFGESISIETKKSGVLLFVDSPLLPGEYPNSLHDLISLVSEKDPQGAYKLLMKQVVSGYERGLVLLAQKTDNGYALGAVSFTGLGLSHRNSLQQGFRKGKVPHKLLIARSTTELKKQPVTRCSVTRVDHAWIHARSGDGGDYQQRSMLVIGCGSLGGYVAHFLSRAGVANLTLLDNDRLEWANLGRHILGAESISKWKAEALSEMLEKQMPHLSIKGIPKDWRDALRDNANLFSDHDLIVITVADWRCEGPLNYLSRNDELPTILFGWLEPYAVAGHCLISVKESGCLACRVNHFGQFKYKVSQFPGNTLKREPGGCTHYQQYGPTALLPVASLISSNALHCLNDSPTRSILKTWVSDPQHFSLAGAEVNKVWERRINAEGYAKVYSTDWDSTKDCQVCA